MFKWLPFGKNKKRAVGRQSVVEASDDSFEVQVLRRSFKQPVMVDFWAAWCAPCRRLGPVLEKLADETDSPFVLVKLNTEHNPRMAARYQIRSIPHVKMFRNGQPIGEFTGVISEPTIRRFIEEKTAGIGPAGGKKATQSPPQRLALARTHLQRGRGFEAFLLLNRFPAGELAGDAADLLPLARFMVDMDDGDGLTGDATLDDLHLAARAALANCDPAGALPHHSAAQALLQPEDDVPTAAVIRSLQVLLGNDQPESV